MDEANAPFGGMKGSGNGSRIGGAAANLESFTEIQWLTDAARDRALPVLILREGARRGSGRCPAPRPGARPPAGAGRA